MSILKEMKSNIKILKMVFCYQNCSDQSVGEKNCSSEGREFAKFLRSLEHFIQTVQ